MRIEPFTVGSYLHVYNRGNRKTEIIRSEKDSWRFMQALRFFNDSHSSVNLLRQVNADDSLLKSNFNRQTESVFELGWPPDWPEKDPLAKIVCYCLLPNHFHLLLKEICEGGISKFMQKLGGGYTNYFNYKYQEIGRVFQGSYKGRTVDREDYLKYLSVYIQVINVLELFKGDIERDFKYLDKALKFAEDYSFSSYRDFLGLRRSLIIDKDIFSEIFKTPQEYKQFTRETIEGRKYEILGNLIIE